MVGSRLMQPARTKTASNLERKTRFLPMSAPVKTVSGLDWSRAWLQLRREARMEAAEGKPLLPAPNDGGSWANVPLSASSAGIWLRSLLQDVGGPELSRVGTHSMKCTLLSWCAKFGLDPSIRRALGYHTSSGDKSINTYARDAMSTPLRELQRVIDSVASGAFLPDQTRSGYFVTAAAEEFDSSSESSGDEEDVEDAKAEEAIDAIAGHWQGTRDISWSKVAAVFFRHSTSRCIHVLQDEAGAEFCCGRRITTAYIRLEKKPDFLHPLCSTCERIINRG